VKTERTINSHFLLTEYTKQLEDWVSYYKRGETAIAWLGDLANAGLIERLPNQQCRLTKAALDMDTFPDNVPLFR
jgi:hypothetical protein